jgi:hypothetical protein
VNRPNSSTGIRIPYGHKGAPLNELQQSIAEIDDAIAHRYKTLRELWRRASTADRGLSLSRYLREGGLPQDLQDVLVTLNENVERAFRAWRQAKGQQSAAARQLEVDVGLAERARDDFLDEEGIFEALFRVSESFLIDVPYERGIRPIQSLLEHKKLLLDQVARLQARRDATVRRRAPVRMLSPLTMSGNIPVMRDQD